MTSLPFLLLWPLIGCTPPPGLADSGPSPDSGSPICSADPDDDDTPETAVTLPSTYAEGEDKPSIDLDDLDWYRKSFAAGEWWSVTVEPDDPTTLEVRITVLDQDLQERSSSTNGLAWGATTKGEVPHDSEPVLMYLKAEAVRGCGSYGFFTYVL